MVIFKRGKKDATILMARVALKVIVLSYTSAVNVDRPITRFLPIRMSESLQTKERLKRLFINASLYTIISSDEIVQCFVLRALFTRLFLQMRLFNVLFSELSLHDYFFR